MNIINLDINKITFDDIVKFCLENQIEGIQLEYKKEFPKKGLSKNIASMVNTRGGLIIVGIEEDGETGIPKAWDGVKNEGKLIERAHQFVSQVDPLPSYDVCLTNENNGNVFLLIRIFEGDRTPYYVQNDANIWVRTGNISNPIDIASPDALELLFRKKEKAEQTRSIYLERTKEIFSAALKRAEKERLRLIDSEKQNYKREQRALGIDPIDWSAFNSSLVQSELGSNTGICTITIQPFYPKKAFVNPIEIRSSIQNIKASGCGYEFPDENYIEMTPFGTLSFYWSRHSGSIKCEQFFGNGLIYNSRDVLDTNKEGHKYISLYEIGYFLFITLKAASNYYDHIGYQGTILGCVRLNNIEDVIIEPIIPAGWRNYSDRNSSLLSNYEWDIDIETSRLREIKSLKTYFIELVNAICISFNYAPPKDQLYEAFFKDCGI